MKKLALIVALASACGGASIPSHDPQTVVAATARWNYAANRSTKRLEEFQEAWNRCAKAFKRYRRKLDQRNTMLFVNGDGPDLAKAYNETLNTCRKVRGKSKRLRKSVKEMFEAMRGLPNG